MNYALGYTLDVGDLFRSFNTSKLELSAKTCEEILGNRHKEIIAEKVFREALNLVVDDVIENNATFILPTKSKRCDIHMKRFTGEEFKKRRRLGKWPTVDFYESIYTAYQMYFNYQWGGIPRDKPIYLDPKHRDRIDEQTNNGVKYF